MKSIIICLLVVAGLTGSNEAFTAPALPASSRCSRIKVIPATSRQSNIRSRPQTPQSWERQSRVVVHGDMHLNEERRDDIASGNKKGGRRWPRKLWSQIRRKNPQARSAPAPLRMLSVDDETEALLESISKHYNDDFILRNFEDYSPTMILPEVEQPTIDSEFFDISITSSGPSATSSQTTEVHSRSPGTSPRISVPRNVSIAGLIGRLLENILKGIIVRNAAETPTGLDIQAFPRGNLVVRLVRGTISTDARINTGRLVFPAIRISSGVLEIKRMTLNVMGFLPTQRPSASSKKKKYLKQFDLHFEDMQFSENDLFFSNCIRNGLQRLLVRILRDRGVKSSSIKVSSLDILSSGKISIKGEAKTLFDSPLSFEVRTGIATESRGHILTFPGLEASLNRDLGLFVPVVPVIDLDIGHNARVRNIEIDGGNKLLRLSASVTICPTSTIRLNDYVQASESFSARFSYDVGQWLTRLGNFTR